MASVLPDLNVQGVKRFAGCFQNLMFAGQKVGYGGIVRLSAEDAIRRSVRQVLSG